MKILFMETFSWAPHLEISGEIALKLKNEQNDVHYHFIFTKNYDQGITAAGLLITIVRVFNLFKIFRKNGIGCTFSFPYFKSCRKKYRFNNLEDIQSYTYKKGNLGLGVASSLNDLINNKNITYQDINEYADRIIPHSNRVFDIVECEIKKHSPDVVYSFNTRFASTRPIYEACKITNTKLNTHESAFHPEKYTISEESIFDGHANSKKIVKFWNKGGDNKYAISESFFKKLVKMHFDEKDILNPQLENYLITGKLNLVYFPSSIHETYSLGELYPQNLFESSEVAMDFLIDYASRNPHVNLIIRIHPIIKDKDLDEQKMWERLFDYKHVKVIHWEDSLSSYDLVKNADYSLVYHSTIGIEAAFLKRKAIVLGTPWYVDLKCIYSPSSIDELTNSLDKGEINYEYDFSDAIMYGYYILEHGTPFKYFKPIGGSKGLLCGKNLDSIL